MSRCKLLVALLLGAAAIGAALCSVTPAQDRPESLSPKLRGLLEQKRDILKERLDVFESQYQAGLCEQDVVIIARNVLLEAELDVAADKAQRLAVLEKRLANAKEYENLMLERRRVGSSNLKLTDALMATVQRLDAEIALVREQDAQN